MGSKTPSVWYPFAIGHGMYNDESSNTANYAGDNERNIGDISFKDFTLIIFTFFIFKKLSLLTLTTFVTKKILLFVFSLKSFIFLFKLKFRSIIIKSGLLLLNPSILQLSNELSFNHITDLVKTVKITRRTNSLKSLN